MAGARGDAIIFFNGNWNLTQLTGDRGGDTGYAYDSRDRKTAVTCYDGSTETFAFGMGIRLLNHVGRGSWRGLILVVCL